MMMLPAMPLVMPDAAAVIHCKAAQKSTHGPRQEEQNQHAQIAT
jgi:hypothetical protein